MRQSQSVRFRRPLAIAAAATAAFALAACSTPASDGGDSSSEETLQIAYISFAVANTYDEPMLAEAQKVADANNAELTVFDGNLDPATQGTLIEDVIASGQYDGMIVQPIYGPAIYDVVKEAIDAGITVVNIDQILGDDFTSGATQLEGLSANVVFVGSILGEKFGKETVAACASQNLDPCNVAYLHDLKTSAVSIALWDAFNEVTAGTPVKVVAEGETFWNPAAAQTAVADILTANPDIDAIVTSDQGLQGAALAIEAAGKSLTDYLLVGYGGSVWGQEHVADGTVFADVLMAPATTGRLGMEALIDALRNGNNHGDVDPFADFPNNGVITKDTADQFTGEWAG
ncbi:sugar ABC transporter substrate-binding protein [Leifsonia sp. H3M29-4]|uniref:sugar ABC transporter substrate-binding protein n=1 Tax=Salinibacterium metalliresistens TaxID=3031321 RepID=UPI0023D990C4|nr:sugar ABC transporter substrate-binding protein [Salinibacterium metalliresistens]MDF1478190.1 sugar ABC transporter substrate-binding protein [Salinibacterium metalliresistens]